VFWHTQGSGKSLSMVFYAHLLQEALASPAIVVLTYRNDLDDQLFRQFAKCSDFLRQFIDERVDSATGRIQKSFGLIIRESLPNASYIGFTGTPISNKDRSTAEVFGNYIDIYDMTQSVEDGATRPVYYESRVIHLKLDEDILRLIDAEYDIMAQNAEDYTIEKSKWELGKIESILGAEETITALCKDIVTHDEENRRHELTNVNNLRKLKGGTPPSLQSLRLFRYPPCGGSTPATPPPGGPGPPGPP
jgi:type I restriction enzyme R subunit